MAIETVVAFTAEGENTHEEKFYTSNEYKTELYTYTLNSSFFNSESFKENILYPLPKASKITKIDVLFEEKYTSGSSNNTTVHTALRKGTIPNQTEISYGENERETTPAAVSDSGAYTSQRLNLLNDENGTRNLVDIIENGMTIVLASRIKIGFVPASVRHKIRNVRLEITYIPKSYLDLNAYFNGNYSGDLEKFGKAYIKINKQVKNTDNPCDYYEALDIGTNYELVNISAERGYRYENIVVEQVGENSTTHKVEENTGVLSGIVGRENISLLPKFHTRESKIYIGQKQAQELYLGQKEIHSIYCGKNLIYG